MTSSDERPESAIRRASTAREIVRSWMREHIDGKDEVSAPGMAAAAVEHFHNAPEIAAALFYQLLYDQALDVLRQTRILGEGTLDAAFTKRGSVWERWYEHSGLGHRRLMKMNRRELLAAAEEREQRAGVELGLARLLRTLAASLMGEEIVEMKFTAEDVARAYAKLEEKGVQDGRVRRERKPVHSVPLQASVS